MKTRSYFVIILFPLISGATVLHTTAYSQDKEVILAQGNPPLTQLMVNKTIQFFEWVLDIRLPAEKVSGIQQFMVRTWKTSGTEDVKGVLDVIDVYNQVVQLNENDRSKAKEQLKTTVLQNIRANPDDELSKTLLEAYESSNSKVKTDTQSISITKSKLRVGTDGFTGLYRMVRPKAISINSTTPESGYYIEHIVFLPGGKLYRGLPPEGLLYFDMTVTERADPSDCGTYEFKNGAIHMLLGPNQTPYVITRNGERLNNPPSLGKGSFRPIPNCDGLKLEGNYRRHESEPTITFTKDGRFTDGGIFGYFGTMAKPDGTLYMDDRKSGSGTYVIEQNTLELRYSDGRVKRVVFQAFPENLVKKPMVESFLLREERFERY
jgi:hypothetical protein